MFLRQAMKRITVSMAGAAMPRGGAPGAAWRADDVEGTAVDVEPRPPGRPGLEA